MSKSRSNKKKKRDGQDDDDDDERVLFFIPSADINIEVLVFYLKEYLGDDSDAEPGVNPRNRDVDGYFISSRLGLTSVMVEDLKRDSADWREEKRRRRTRMAYAESDTATNRLEKGASGRPTIPKKTQELAAARRAEAAQPGQGTSQLNTTQLSGARHTQQDTIMQTGSYPPGFYPADTNQRHEATYPGQQPAFGYASPQVGQARPQPAINVNLNMAAYQHTVPARHQSPSQPTVLPSIEDRSGYQNTPAPPYEEGDSRRDNKQVPPSQPSSTGTQGFSIYPTAGSRHDRAPDRPPARR